MAREPDPAIELRRKLRALPPVEWFLWQVQPRETIPLTTPIKRPMLPWPYLNPPREERPGAGWGKLWIIQSIDFTVANRQIEEARETVQKLQGWVPELHHIAHPMGRMFGVMIEMSGRGGPYKWLFTPPVYKFCDLDKAFPELGQQDPNDLSRRITPGPFDFWIQPQVYAETGEILQGAPTWEGNLADAHYSSSQPRELASMLADRRGREGAAAGVEMLEHVHVALDAWIEDYERTGVVLASSDFVWTWAEQRRRAEVARRHRCEVAGCVRPPAIGVKLRNMQTVLRVCREHSEHYDPHALVML